MRLVALRPDMTRRAMFEAARDAVKLGPACYLEKVGVMPRDGKVGAFTFGRVAGLLEAGAYAGAGGAEVVLVPPQIWQSKMECLSGGNKNVTKNRAQQLFPGVHITHATADALLIAEFGRRRLLAERHQLFRGL